MPPKIWRLQPDNRYIPLDYGTKIDDGVFDYSHYGNMVYCPKLRWANRDRLDIIQFNKVDDLVELKPNIRICDKVLPAYKGRVEDISR